jgi:hypothetical protein
MLLRPSACWSPATTSRLLSPTELGAGRTGLELLGEAAQRWPLVGLILSSGAYSNQAELPRGAVLLPKPWLGGDLIREVQALADRGTISELT